MLKKINIFLFILLISNLSYFPAIALKNKIISSVRGKGLLNAIVLNCDIKSEIPWKICLKMKENGLLAKPTQGNIIRFAPPLVISKRQLIKAIKIIDSSLREF